MCENPEEDIAHLSTLQNGGVVSGMNRDGMLADGVGVCGNGVPEVPAVAGGGVTSVVTVLPSQRSSSQGYLDLDGYSGIGPRG